MLLISTQISALCNWRLFLLVGYNKKYKVGGLRGKNGSKSRIFWGFPELIGIVKIHIKSISFAQDGSCAL